MEDNHQPEIQEELDLTPFVCSHCSTEVLPKAEPWPETCPTCQRSFDLRAQFAYCRGQDAFTAGQDLLINISPKVRKRDLTTEAEMEGIHYYIQAYTALQESFKGDLAESQRNLGIEMMAAIGRVFMQHDMVSPLESAYWVNLLIERNSLTERDVLLEKVETAKERGLLGLMQNWRWRVRLNQLEKGLADLDAKILNLERNIAFIDPPRVRRRKQQQKNA